MYSSPLRVVLSCTPVSVGTAAAGGRSCSLEYLQLPTLLNSLGLPHSVIRPLQYAIQATNYETPHCVTLFIILLALYLKPPYQSLHNQPQLCSSCTTGQISHAHKTSSQFCAFQPVPVAYRGAPEIPKL
jgi:hypothetical protein